VPAEIGPEIEVQVLAREALDVETQHVLVGAEAPDLVDPAEGLAITLVKPRAEGGILRIHRPGMMLGNRVADERQVGPHHLPPRRLDLFGHRCRGTGRKQPRPDQYRNNPFHRR
jgi:hypothetical protein